MLHICEQYEEVDGVFYKIVTNNREIIKRTKLWPLTLLNKTHGDDDDDDDYNDSNDSDDDDDDDKTMYKPVLDWRNIVL